LLAVGAEHAGYYGAVYAAGHGYCDGFRHGLAPGVERGDTAVVVDGWGMVDG
jgi:hypothetical protein